MELFGEAAMRLCSAASVLLGWSPSEFWSATPAELAVALQPAGADAELTTMDELKRRFPGDEGLSHG
jgi:hypothetical protein